MRRLNEFILSADELTDFLVSKGYLPKETKLNAVEYIFRRNDLVLRCENPEFPEAAYSNEIINHRVWLSDKPPYKETL